MTARHGFFTLTMALIILLCIASFFISCKSSSTDPPATPSVKHLSWSQTSLEHTGVYSIAQGLNGTIYAKTDSGVFRSTTSGATWNKVHAPIRYAGVVVHPNGTVFLSDAGQWIRSTDDGATWNGLSLPSLAFFMTATPNGSLYTIVYTDTTHSYRFFRSVDLGETWTWINAGLPGDVNDAVVHAGTEGTLFTTTQHHGLYQSVNEGSLWTSIDTLSLPMQISSGFLVSPRHNVFAQYFLYDSAASAYTLRLSAYRNGSGWKAIPYPVSTPALDGTNYYYVVDDNGTTYGVGTHTLFVSIGTEWVDESAGMPVLSTGYERLTLLLDGSVLAATDSAGVFHGEWK